MQADSEALRRHWELQVEEAEFEARRAERQFHAVEPENRLVGRELERRWNERLGELETVRQAAEEAWKRTSALSEEDIARASRLASHLDEAWNVKGYSNNAWHRVPISVPGMGG